MLHILNGDATRLPLERSGVPGTFAVWADVLYEGQVLPLEVGAERWREARARAIAAADWASYSDALRTAARWEAAIERFPEHEEVVIWCEHDLFDQLLLIRHLAWFARRDLGRTTLSLICVGEFPGRPSFHGLGELGPEELASLLPTRAPVTPREHDLGSRAFSAFTSTDPRAVERLLHDDTSPLPFLAPALARLLREYPSVGNGLSRTEEDVLALLAASGPMRASDLLRGMHARESAYYVTDLTLYALLRRFAAPPALLTRAAAASGREWDAEVAIAPAGVELLAGRGDLARLRGVDRWIGGVHLEGTEPEWRWDEGRAKLVRAGSMRA